MAIRKTLHPGSYPTSSAGYLICARRFIPGSVVLYEDPIARSVSQVGLEGCRSPQKLSGLLISSANECYLHRVRRCNNGNLPTCLVSQHSFIVTLLRVKFTVQHLQGYLLENRTHKLGNDSITELSWSVVVSMDRVHIHRPTFNCIVEGQRGDRQRRKWIVSRPQARSLEGMK